MKLRRLLIADDHQLFRRGLGALISAKLDDVEIVAEAADGCEAVALARRHRPDVILMDIAMPNLNGIEAVRQICEELPSTHIIALSMHTSIDYVTQMLGAGARGYLNKNAAFNELSKAIEFVSNGEIYLSRQVRSVVFGDYHQIMADYNEGEDARLSHEEMKVLKLAAEGLHAPEIADKLKISAAAVKLLRKQINRKVQLNGVAEVKEYAARTGIIDS